MNTHDMEEAAAIIMEAWQVGIPAMPWHSNSRSAIKVYHGLDTGSLNRGSILS